MVADEVRKAAVRGPVTYYLDPEIDFDLVSSWPPREDGVFQPALGETMVQYSTTGLHVADLAHMMDMVEP